MKAVIVAAGEGKRLRNLSPIKPLSMVAGKTLVRHAIGYCAAAGADEVVLVLGYRADAIEAHLRQIAPELPIPVRSVVNDDWRAGNGSSLLAAGTAVAGEDFILTMCDHICAPQIISGLIECIPSPEVDLVLGVDRRLANPLVDLQDVTRVNECDSHIVSIGKMLSDYNCFDTGVFRMSDAVFTILRELSIGQAELGISDLVAVLAGLGRAKVHDIGNLFWIDIDDDRMHALAEAYLDDMPVENSPLGGIGM